MERDPGRLFENTIRRREKRSPASFPISVVLHVVLVGLFVVVPILTSQDLPEPPPSPNDGIRVIPTIKTPAPPPEAPPNGGKRSGGKAAVEQKQVTGQPAIPTVMPIELPDFELERLRGGEKCKGCVVGGFGMGPAQVIVPGLGNATNEAKTIHPIGGFLQEPKRIHYVPPVYPETAKRAGLQGTVKVKCVIDAMGNVVDVRIVKNLPFLGEAAMNAVRQWTYMPTLLNGVPITISMDVNVTFTIQR